MAKINRISNNYKANRPTDKILRTKVFFIFWDKYKLFAKTEIEKENIVANLKRQSKKYKIITKFLI